MVIMPTRKQFLIQANFYAGSIGVNLHFGGQKAYTDGVDIYMPHPQPEYMDLAYGFISHEASHIKHSDFDNLLKWVSQWENASFAKWLLNVVEDERIERLFLLSFSGARAYFEETAKWLVEKGKCNPPVGDLKRYVFYTIRGRLSDYKAMERRVSESMSYATTLDADFINSLDALLLRCKSNQDSKQVYDLAEEILLFLGFEKVQDSDESKSNESQDDSNESDSDESQDDSDESESDESQDDSDESESDESQDDSDESDSDESQDDSDKSKSNGKDIELDDHTKEQIESVRESNGEEDDLDGEDAEISDAIKEILQSSDAIDPKAEALILNEIELELNVEQQPSCDSSVLIADSAIATGTLRSKLHMLVSNMAREQKTLGRKGRTINPKRYASRAPIGNPNVFVNKHRPEIKPNASVCVLIDDSGSIGDHLRDVKNSAWTLIDTLSTIQGVDTCAYAFGTTVSKSGVSEIKSWPESSKVASERISTLCAGGHSTPLFPALEASERAFMFSSDSKPNIIIVLTDGGPNNIETCSTKICEFRHDGVRVIGIGVGSGVDSRMMSTQYGTDFVLVPTFEHLPEKVLEISKQIIIPS
ncbi:vWA domain-containing protein [Vibrio crassostreae]|uniref:vWA domain-containing protein n=1 Tax=Vibrio crassostreae TaxID=246167 RepID=UPI001B307087|nr:vWA domain-containing protein [Vibrio crassostreae]